MREGCLVGEGRKAWQHEGITRFSHPPPMPLPTRSGPRRGIRMFHCRSLGLLWAVRGCDCCPAVTLSALGPE